MHTNTDTFMDLCNRMTIAKEQEVSVSLSTKIFAGLKKLIISCRHAIRRFLYGLKQTKKISVPKDIELYASTLTTECRSILGALQFDKYTRKDFDEKLKDLKDDKRYKILFNKEDKIYHKNVYVAVDAKKVIQTLRELDKELEVYEKELIDVSELSKHSIYNTDTLTCSVIILSEAVQIQSKLLSWKASNANDEVIDLGVNINAEYDHPSF